MQSCTKPSIWLLLKSICRYNIQHVTNETRTTKMPAFWGYTPPPHDYWVILDPKSKEGKVKVTNLKNLPKFLIFEFWNKLYMQHTSWSCLIRCANMKWIWWVLLKMQSRHDSVHRWTDGQTDGQGETNIHPFNFVEAEGIISDPISWDSMYIAICHLMHTMQCPNRCKTTLSWPEWEE